jgi:hypothetical protein
MLLIGFENLSGLKINYTKSELVPLNLTQSEGSQITTIIGCKIVSLPITYLGVPLHWHKLRIKDWDFLVNKVDLKLEHWKGKLLSIGGRLTLVKAVLSAIPIYWMVIFRIPIRVRKRIDRVCRKFLWHGGNTIRKKYNLVSWQQICYNQDQGGL